MRFIYPEFIYLMLVPAMGLIYLIATNKDAVERVFDAEVLDRLRIEGDALGKTGHNALVFVAFFFMVLALAQPVIDKGVEQVKVPGGDLAVALDLSRSMEAKDRYPDRLTFAKEKLTEILPALPSNRIGIIGFTRASFIIAPLSEDREALRFLLERLPKEATSLQGTDLKAALEGAAELLEKSRDRTVLLVTDGGEERDVRALADFAKKHRLRIVVWMTATKEGAPVPGVQGRKPVISRANGALKYLAGATGGLYVPATLSQADEASIVHFLKEKMRHTGEYEKVVHHRIQLFYYPLAIALLILPFALYSFGGRSRIVGLLLLFALACSSSIPLEAGVLDFVTIDRGTKAYKRGDYRQSTDAFEKVAITTDRPEAWFDLGNSYYRSGRYKMACDAYGRVVTDKLWLERAKLYNLANCYVKLGDLRKAAELYRKVLSFGEEPNARYNLELVLKYLEKEKKQQGGGKKRSEKEGEGKKRSQKGSDAEKNARARKGGKGEGKGKPRPITPREERKWMEMIEKEPVVTKLYPLTPPKKEPEIAHPW
ncbi:VWA domain-containing protein [Hydrogenimonas sp. SS33]|uniref:vWA domain-containing protein n=1 Tax=Hydrogenimonas leucolamina TaxID=2954236 RepID=UPI00336C0FF0